MKPGSRIRKILIVGGGTAGWMSAAYLRRRTPCEISLIEAPGIGTVGVGEATIPSLVQLLRDMRIDEDDWMRRCGATYKLAIHFRDWLQPGHAYWHPFGSSGGRIQGLDLFHFWLKAALETGSDRVYSDYSIQALLCRTGRGLRPIAGRPIVENYAYHLDAGAFGDFLRELATGEGVAHLQGEVENVVLDEHGNVDHLVTADGRLLDADLFIDCSGFRGLLLEQALGDPWIDWSDTLLCDRAAVLRLPADPSMRPYTRSTALGAGWAWQIPLAGRTGSGYVYSSAHTSEDEAVARLLEMGEAGEERAPEVGHLQMRVGRRSAFWRSNCVSVGLASGFIEPLESTGIYFIQRALELLVEFFPDTGFDPSLRDAFNQTLGVHYEEVRDFVMLHYLVSKREEDFWRDARSVAIPDSLASAIERHAAHGLVVLRGAAPCFRETNWHHIFAGGGWLPRAPLPQTAFTDFAAVQRLLEEIRSKNEQLASRLPTSGQLAEWLHGKREDSRTDPPGLHPGADAGGS